jgi:predicted Fe-Mo cluster-binding NifX family protein
MRIAVSAEQGAGLASPVSGHFGRCPCFVIVEVERSSPVGVMVVENPFYGQHRPGQVPAFIRQQGAEVLITGGMGGRAVGFFQEYGIEPVTGARGSVEEAVRAYLAGELAGAAPCRESIEHGHGYGDDHST